MGSLNPSTPYAVNPPPPGLSIVSHSFCKAVQILIAGDCWLVGGLTTANDSVTASPANMVQPWKSIWKDAAFHVAP